MTAAAFGGQDEARLVEAIRACDDFGPELTLVAVEDGRVVAAFMAVPLRAYDPTLRGRVRVAPPFD